MKKSKLVGPAHKIAGLILAFVTPVAFGITVSDAELGNPSEQKIFKRYSSEQRRSKHWNRERLRAAAVDAKLEQIGGVDKEPREAGGQPSVVPPPASPPPASPPASPPPASPSPTSPSPTSSSPAEQELVLARTSKQLVEGGTVSESLSGSEVKGSLSGADLVQDMGNSSLAGQKIPVTSPALQENRGSNPQELSDGTDGISENVSLPEKNEKLQISPSATSSLDTPSLATTSDLASSSVSELNSQLQEVTSESSQGVLKTSDPGPTVLPTSQITEAQDDEILVEVEVDDDSEGGSDHSTRSQRRDGHEATVKQVEQESDKKDSNMNTIFDVSLMETVKRNYDAGSSSDERSSEYENSLRKAFVHLYNNLPVPTSGDEYVGQLEGDPIEGRVTADFSDKIFGQYPMVRGILKHNQAKALSIKFQAWERAVTTLDYQDEEAKLCAKEVFQVTLTNAGKVAGQWAVAVDPRGAINKKTIANCLGESVFRPKSDEIREANDHDIMTIEAILLMVANGKASAGKDMFVLAEDGGLPKQKMLKTYIGKAKKEQEKGQLAEHELIFQPL